MLCDDGRELLRWCCGDIVVMLWMMLWSYSGDVMVMLQRCCNVIVVMLWWYCGDVEEMLWWGCGNVVEMSRCCGDVVEMLWGSCSNVLCWCICTIVNISRILCSNGGWCLGDIVTLWCCCRDVIMILWEVIDVVFMSWCKSRRLWFDIATILRRCWSHAVVIM